MRTKPEVLEAAVVASWRFMKRDDPVWDFNITDKRFPEAMEAHRKLVAAMLETNCDPMRAITKASGGKLTYADMFESAQNWNKKLAGFLRSWAGEHGLT